MSIRLLILGITASVFSLNACASFQATSRTAFAPASSARAADTRDDALRRAQLWRPTRVGSMNIKAGPTGPQAFPSLATVSCTYVDKKLSGNSPKFACDLGGDEVKVKIGGANGEVYGEVAATRLLWALGFGADRMYPVKVVCKGCPEELGGIERRNGESIFDPAVIERKLPGAEFPNDPGWSWHELDKIDESAGGAPRSHRDALKLLAVFLQHTDTKKEQQRLLCLDEPDSKEAPRCRQPFLIINDLGLTFGRASTFNNNSKSGVNLEEWTSTPVWKDETTCTGNLPKSFTGTLDNPVISEAGRKFLANLLVQLSDQQIRDLFEVSRVHLRLRAPGETASGFAGIDEWVAAFKQKREAIVTRRCT